MSRIKNLPRRGKGARNLTAAHLEFADKFVDLLLVQKNDWLRHYFFCDGFTFAVGSVTELAIQIITATQRDFLIEAAVFEAVQNKNKEFLVEYVKGHLTETQPEKDSLFFLLNALESRNLRNEVKRFAGIFQTHRGPKPKINREQYAQLLRIADSIEPVIKKILAWRSENMRRTLDEMLDFLEKDHPAGSQFLKRNKLLFEKALADPKLLARAKKNSQKRARVLSYALAGSEFDLARRYSHDLARAQGKPTKHGPEIAG